MKGMIVRRIAAAAALVLAFAAVPGARADQQVVDGVTWTYSVSGGKATITGASPLPSALVFPNNLGGFTEMIIKDYLFQTRSVLKSVQISDGVAVIGGFAFSKCPNLTSVKTGNGVKNIGEHAFIECRNLKSATIGNNVTNIGIWAFGYCTNLVSLSVGDGVRTVQGNAFGSCYRLPFLAFPNELESVGSQAFGGCSSLEFLAVPASWKGTTKLNGTSVPSFTTVCYGSQKVTFNANGGMCAEPSRRFGVGATYADFGGFPDATMQGNRLLGWYSSASAGTEAKESDTVSSTAPRTLYAHWRKVQVVTFDANGGNCATATKTVDRGGVLDRYGELPEPTWKGHAFLGWFTEANGGTQVTADDSVTYAGARTLYAHWLAARPVFRFYSKKYKGHFFTIDEAEKEDLIAHNPNWSYEGVAYLAFAEEAPGTTALYRFYSKNYKGHFFTIDEEEMWTVRNTNPNWKYEGIAYYVYPEAVAETSPVHRFWSKRYRHHFYTIDEAEKNDLVAHNPNWKYERVAFHAFSTVSEVEAEPGPATTTAQSLVWTLAHGDIVPGSLTVSIDGAVTLVDQGDGHFGTYSSSVSGTIDYAAGKIVLSFSPAVAGRQLAASYRYFDPDDALPSVVSAAVSAESAPAANAECRIRNDIATTADTLGKEWTLQTEDRTPVAARGVTEVGGTLVETRGEAPDAGELESHAESAEFAELGSPAGGAGERSEPEVAIQHSAFSIQHFSLSLPSGLWRVSLWSAADGPLADEDAEGSFEFDLPATGAWHWLRVRDAADADAGDAFSVWIRAE